MILLCVLYDLIVLCMRVLRLCVYDVHVFVHDARAYVYELLVLCA